MPIIAAIVAGSICPNGRFEIRFEFEAEDELFAEFEFLLPGGRPRGRGVTVGAGGGGSFVDTDVAVAVVDEMGTVVTVTVEEETGLAVVRAGTLGCDVAMGSGVSVAVVPAGRLCTIVSGSGAVTTAATTSLATMAVVAGTGGFISERTICAGRKDSGWAGAGRAPPFLAKFFRNPISCWQKRIA